MAARGGVAAASSGAEKRRRRPSSTGSVLSTKENQFPAKLYEMLEAIDGLGLSDAVSWLPHGRSFKVLDPDKFMNLVVPQFFKATKYRSFQRQLNLWGFVRIVNGRDNGCWQHDSFLRGRPDMISKITRTRIKGRKVQPRATAKSTQANSPPSILTASSYDSSSDGGKEVDEDCDAGDEDYRSIASDNTRQVNNMSSHSHSSHLPNYHYNYTFQDDIFDAKLSAMFSESTPSSRDNSAVINNDGNHPLYIEPLPINSVSIWDAHGDSRNNSSEQLAEFGKLLDHLM